MKKGLFIALIVLLVSTINAQDFTVVVLPDIQNMPVNDGRQQNLFNEMQYIIDNKQSMSTKFVVSLGDLTPYGYDGYQSQHINWQLSKQSSDMIVNANIPYAVCVGNHDMDWVPNNVTPSPYTRFNQYFPVSDFQNKPYFGGYYRDMSNAYYFMTAAGMDFIILVLQNTESTPYDQNVENWANQILNQYPNHRAIISTHMLYPGDNYTSKIISKHDNVFLAVYGHDCGDSGERHWTATTPSGKSVHCIMTDYQCRSDNGYGATLRWYTFKPSENKIYAKTYNTFAKYFETDASSEFSWDYVMNSSAPSIILSQNQTIMEGEEDGKIITVSAQNSEFKATLNTANWTISNLPSGVTVSSISRISNTMANITLAGNSTIGTYSANITNVTVTIANSEFVNTATNLTANSGITLIKAMPQAPGFLEAENYTLQSGTAKEVCTDTGGGSNVANIETGDWMTYDINVKQTGTYTVSYRVATTTTGKSLKIEAAGGSKVYGTVNLPNTNGWQAWQTVSHEIQLTQGVQSIGIASATGGYNLNWIKFELKSYSPTISNINLSPAQPTNQQPTIISAQIADNGTISSALLKWGTQMQSLSNTVSLINANGIYSGSISAQNNGTTIYYQISATDNENNTTLSTILNYTVTPENQSFTIGVLPDIQNMSQSDVEAQKIKDEINFFVNNKANLNIKMVCSLGDNVYGYSSDAVMQAEYNRVKPAFNLLKDASIPYTPCVGNHDGQLNDQTFTMFNTFFPLSEMQSQNPYLSGNLNGSANTYYLFTAAGVDYVLVVVETHDQFIIADKKLDYDQASITWANTIFSNYSQRKGILISHDLFEPSGYNLVTDIVKKNDNIILALCGHSCSRAGFNGQITGEYNWTETTSGGKKVHCVLSNYQCDTDKGATLRYYTFNTAANTICAYTYNVAEKVYRTDANSQFCLNLTTDPITTEDSWKSYNVVMNSNLNEQATVTANSGTANVRFYESTNDDGVDVANYFTNFNASSHADAFNNASTIWSSSSYPYAGKSSVMRGNDVGETNVTAPLGVFDLQVHPPSNNHLTVCEFTAPESGTYAITDIAVRRVYQNSAATALKVFDNKKKLISTVTANSRAWVSDPSIYTVSNITAGEKLYFAVDNVDGFDYDATEINWSVTFNGTSTSFSENENISINISPNPVKRGGNTILQSNINSQTALIKINDITGRFISQMEVQMNEKLTLETSQLESGIYLIQIVTNNNIYTQKIIVR